MHRDNAVELWSAAVPSRAVDKVRANERGNLTNSISRDARGYYIPYNHVALGMELLPVVILDPLTA
jgi:hypothetical protein